MPMKSRQRNLVIEVLYDTFNVPTPIINIQMGRVSKRNRWKMLELNPNEENTYSKENAYI